MNRFNPRDFKKNFAFLNFRTESFEKLHSYCEDKIGKSLLEVCAQSMSRKIAVEWDLSRKHFNIIPGQDQDNDKIPLVIKQDMQWLQRGFYSPGGSMHTFGGLSNGIITTNLLINKCTVCNKYNAEKIMLVIATKM